MDAHSLDCLDFPRIRELLARHALSSLGRHLALSVEPIAKRELVQRWHAQFTELRDFALDHGPPPFGGISDVRDVVRNCAPPLTVTLEQLGDVRNTLRGTHALADYLAKLPPNAEELQYLARRMGDFSTVAERIDRLLDDRGQVRDDASPKLAAIRRDIEAASRAIEDTVERLLRDAATRRLLQYPNHTFHNDRLVLPVRAECRGRLTGIIHRTSDSGATIYVEPSQAVELNNEISNLRTAETEEINRLLWEISHEIYVNSSEIIKTLDALAVLDLITAKVRLAAAFRFECPQLVDEPLLDVRDARHPLLLDLFRQRATDGAPPADVVPVSYRLGDDFDLLVITGPNTGGKTVTLKTVGLLALMVQAGLPIPADRRSRCGLFSNILIDIGDEQNMQQSLSTFSGHMQRLLDMLKRASERTLVLIDELGAGTDPDEGGAIGRALLDELLRLRCRCIATTHIGALKSFALTRERAENGCVEFDSESLRPTYHLRIGEAGASNALEIAQRLGMPKRLVAAAKKNLSHRAKALRSALAGAAAAKREAEQARRSAESARSDAYREHAEARAARDQLDKQRREFEHWVSRVAHLQPGDAVRIRNFDRDGKIVRLRLEQQRAEVDVGAFAVDVALADVLPPQTVAPPPPPKPPTPPPKQKSKSKSRPAASSKKPRPQPAAPPAAPKHLPLNERQLGALQAGDRVFAQRFERVGTVARVNREKRLAVVSVGLFEVEIPFDGLAAVTPVTSQSKHRRKPRGASKPAGNADETSPKDASTGDASKPATPSDQQQ